MKSRPALAVGRAPARVHVLGPDSHLFSGVDLRHLFKEVSVPAGGEGRLRRSCRVVVTCDDRVTGLAAYESNDTELRVHEFALDPPHGYSTHEIVNLLLDALELACQAGGCSRLVLVPSVKVADAILRRRGYVIMPGGFAGSWREKTF